MSVLNQLRTKVASKAKQEKLAMIKKAAQLCRPSKAKLQKCAAAMKELDKVLEKHAITWMDVRNASRFLGSGYRPLYSAGIGAGVGAVGGAVANPEDRLGGATRGMIGGGILGGGVGLGARLATPGLTRVTAGRDFLGKARTAGRSEKILARQEQRRKAAPATWEQLKAYEQKKTAPHVVSHGANLERAGEGAEGLSLGAGESEGLPRVPKEVKPKTPEYGEPGYAYEGKEVASSVKKAMIILKKKAAQRKS